MIHGGFRIENGASLSRGNGEVQRYAVTYLKAATTRTVTDAWIPARDIAAAKATDFPAAEAGADEEGTVSGPPRKQPTPSQLESMRRALRTLAAHREIDLAHVRGSLCARREFSGELRELDEGPHGTSQRRHVKIFIPAREEVPRNG